MTEFSSVSFTRRQFLRASAGAAAAGALGFPAVVRAAGPRRPPRIVVLGVDGMDPALLRVYAAQGLMPHCARLLREAHFSPLQTVNPPQSPVAWSNFISGANPGGHGLFDFIAREAETLRPYLSSARTLEPTHSLTLGKFSLPVAGARVELLRKGHTLWNLLQNAGMDCTVFRAPVNFPPTPGNARTVSGLTTPDLRGSYGVFTLFTEDPRRRAGSVSGGEITRLVLSGNRAACALPGPVNSLRRDAPTVSAPFSVELDAGRGMAHIRVAGRQILLRPGEWSDWIQVPFPMIPHLAEVSGICRFLLKSARPYLELYVSPVNIDPADPAMPISTPASYARELAEELGPFYTQGMPEDTAALSAGVFDDNEYRTQATQVLDEQMRFYQHELGRFESGFFYAYFSSLDLNSHAFWRCVDPAHPLHTESLVKRHGDFLPGLYAEMDRAVGMALRRIEPGDLLCVVSDHGFAPFRRQFNLNSWLMDNGYAAARHPRDRGMTNYFANTDWPQTRAYGLGINSLYLNIRGREPDGCVAPGAEAEAVRQKLIDQLTSVRDPETGEAPIAAVYRPETIYSGPHVASAPDLIVAYNRNYRASWDTILGKYPRDVFLENRDPWSGDHCMDARFLPGVLLCNRPVTSGTPRLEDIAASILAAARVPAPGGMTGRNVLGERA